MKAATWEIVEPFLRLGVATQINEDVAQRTFGLNIGTLDFEVIVICKIPKSPRP